MGALEDARRRTGRFLREHEELIGKATGRVKSAADGVLERTGARAKVERDGPRSASGPTPPSSGQAPRPSGEAPRPSAPRPSPRAPRPSGSRSSRSPRGPSVSRVREQAERLESGVSRVGNETETEQLVRQNTKAELMRRAHALEVKGRSRMTKQQLAEQIHARG